MFSISRFCLAKETRTNYSPDKLGNFGSLNRSGSSHVEIWSFRPCLFSIKEILDRGIYLGNEEENNDNTNAKNYPIKLDNHRVPDGSPLTILFKLMGPMNNPFETPHQSTSFLLANGVRDLELFATECWKQADIFGSTSNLVRGLRALSRSEIGHDVSGDFSRTKAALKLLLPDEEIKIKGTLALSKFMDTLCEDIASGNRKSPEINVSMRYLIIRLLYGSGSGEFIPTCFLKQFKNNTIPIKAYTKEISDISKDGEATVYISKDQLGKTPKYKTICLARNEGGPSDMHSYKSGKKGYVICRIVPDENEKVVLSLSCGGMKNGDDRNRSPEILSLSEIAGHLDSCGIKYTKNRLVRDGSVRTGQKEKLLVSIDGLDNLTCYKSWFSLESVNPEVTSREKQEVIKIPKLHKDIARIPEFSSCQLYCTGQAIHEPNADILDKLAICLNTDTSLIKRIASKAKHLEGKILSAYAEVDVFLPDVFSQFYHSGKSLISKTRSSESTPRNVKISHDVLVSTGKRVIYRSYITSEQRVANTYEAPYIGDPRVMIGKDCCSWILPWSGIDRIFFIKEKETFLRKILLLPGSTINGDGAVGIGAISTTDTPTFIYSPLVEIYARLFKRLLDKNLISLPTCSCGSVDKKKDLKTLGEYNSKISSQCEECYVLKPLVFALFRTFILSHTSRGTYLDWWDSAPGLLDTDDIISNLINSDNSVAKDNQTPITLIVHNRAINNGTSLRS